MIALWDDYSRTYECFVKLSKESDALTTFKVDTGASFTILGSNVLSESGLLSVKSEKGLLEFFKFLEISPKEFINASDDSSFMFLCSIDNIEIDDIKFEKFYFFLDSKSTNIALLGNDVLHNCKFSSTKLGNMLVKDFNYEEYIKTVENLIKIENIEPFHINSLIFNFDKQQEDIRNTASSFRELYKSRKDD